MIAPRPGRHVHFQAPASTAIFILILASAICTLNIRTRPLQITGSPKPFRANPKSKIYPWRASHRLCRNNGAMVSGCIPDSDWQAKIGVFNMLCPTYRRMDSEGNQRESSLPEVYSQRIRDIIEMLKTHEADVFCLQEYWVESSEIQEMFLDELQHDLRGYRMIQLKRTSHWAPRDDGLAILLGPRTTLKDVQEIVFQDCGDRVALMVQACVNSKKLLIVNTHLLFPHNKYSTSIRLREVRKILSNVQTYQKTNNLTNTPVIVCGDFNGSPNGAVATYMQQQGFNLCIGGPRSKRDNWISHKTHRNTTLMCDHVWVLNPSNRDQFRPEDWKDRVFSEIDYQIQQRNLSLSQSFKKFFDQDSNNLVTPDEFRRALKELGFSGPGSPHLLDIEIDALMNSADMDQNGMLDYKEFIDRFWVATKRPELLQGISPTKRDKEGEREDQDVKFFQGLDIKASILETEDGSSADADDVQDIGSADILLDDATVYPPELTEGKWPGYYMLSDHGMIVSTFRADIEDSRGASTVNVADPQSTPLGK
mmetsp:Transcript_30453/g.48876  ORF Transcript_30453/g.48876 Transcript_30453/m.48876 type:complete len:537 (-) Transcript_30453:34-1644(-)